MAYNKDTDYQALINKAVASGDYRAAAQYEQARNEKIADLNASGTNKWNAQSTNKYSQYLMPSGFSGSANSVYTHNNNQASIQQQMNQNSIDWWSADRAGKAALEAANKQLAAQLGSGVTFNPQLGTWSGAADVPASVKTGVDIPQPTFDYNAYVQENPAPTFDYSGYVQSNPAPTYDSQYSARIDALLNQILNRESFSYDAETDPLYQQYKKQYNREGIRAMNDTMAAAASNAGGMNSYAMTAAQQANDYYSAQLTDKIPELYQLAYEMYLQDIDNQVRDLGLLQEIDDTQYGRYRDTMNDWRDDRDFAYGIYRDDRGDWENDRNFAYGSFRDNMADYQWGTEFNYGADRDQIADQRYDQEWQYNVGRDKVEDSRYENGTSYERAMDMLLQGVMPNSTLLANAGISATEAQALVRANTPTVTGGTGGSSGGSSGGSKKSGSSGSSGYTGGTGSKTETSKDSGYKGSTGSKTGTSGQSVDSMNANDPYAGTKYGNTYSEVWNRNGESWVYIPGHGRYSWQEVERYVDSGQIKEERTSDGKLKYTWVDKPAKKYASGGGGGGKVEHMIK